MKTPDEMQAEWAEAIRVAGAATEAEMRDATVPTPVSIEALGEYVRGLVERPHDYGTCVYAISMAATAAFNFVAGKLGVTGFQESCADMDILCRTRGLTWGRLLNFDDLLYPQYRDKFGGWDELIEENKVKLAEKAREKLAEHAADGLGSTDVVAHWRFLASLAG